jgi:hypothetical protein
MQSFPSETLGAIFRNPTILAMIGSAGIHGVFVLFSAVNPAESLPTPLRIISIDSGSSTTDLNRLLASNGLPVPNGLPPINLGDVPELSTLPDVSKLGRPPSQSMYLGSDPSTLNLGKISIANPPQKSIAGSQSPVYGFNLPKDPSLKIKGSPQFPLGGKFSDNPALMSKGQKPLIYPDYSFNPNQPPPNVAPGTVAPSSTNPGSIKEDGKIDSGTPSGMISPSPSISPDIAASGDNAAKAREQYAKYLESQKQAYGQALSTKPGPRLTASYPLSACSDKKVEGSALIAAIFGPDGSIKGDTIQVIQAAETLALNRAAIAAVKAYQLPNPSGISQSFTFPVEIPYSEAVCNAQSSPKAPVKESPSTTPPPAVSPSPSPQISSPTIKPTPTPQSSSSTLKPTPTPQGPVDNPVPPGLITPSPEASQSSSPTRQSPPTLNATQSPEPLPAPSIAVPEASPTQP